MAEIELILIVYGSTDSIKSMQLLFPISIVIIHDLPALHKRLSASSKSLDKNIKRYFILLLDNIETEADYQYGQLEANSQVICVFLQWNDSFRPPMNITKLYYIPTPLLTLVVSLGTVQFFKVEAQQQAKAHQNSPTNLYLRKAASIKDWMMNTMRVCDRQRTVSMKRVVFTVFQAQPCHILVIPLNTATGNLTEVLEYLRENCE